MKKLLSLPKEYDAKLKIVSRKLGITQSELIRRALDDYLVRVGFPLVYSTAEEDEVDETEYES